MQAKIVNFATHMESIKEFKKGMDFTVKTFAGLEDALATELKELGADFVQGYAIHKPAPLKKD